MAENVGATAGAATCPTSLRSPEPQGVSAHSGNGQAQGFLLVKRGLYYRPGGCGYTGIKEQAGRYRKDEACPESGITAVHESAAPEYAPGCFHDLAAAHMAKRVAELGAGLTDLLRGRVSIPAQPLDPSSEGHPNE